MYSYSSSISLKALAYLQHLLCTSDLKTDQQKH